MRRPLFALALLFLAAVTASVAVASPQPTPVCGPCGEGFAMVAERTDGLDDVKIERSTAAVRVHEDGSATWRVTNRFARESTVDYLADDPARLDRIAGDAIERGTVDGPFRNVSATTEGATIRVRYRDPDAVRRVHGVTLVEYFHTRGHDSWAVITANELTVVGPNGTTVTNDPPGATVDGRNATWHGNASSPLREAQSLGQGAYVAFDEGGGWSGVRTSLAIATATAPIVADVLGGFILPPLAVLGLGLAVLSLGSRRLVWRSTRDSFRRAAIAITGLGVLSAFLGLVATALPQYTGTRWLVELGVVYLTVGAVALLRGNDARPRDLLGAGGLALVGIAVALAVTAPAGFASVLSHPSVVAERVLALSLPVAMLAAGASLASDRRLVRVLGALVVLPFFAGLQLSLVWPAQRPQGIALVFFIGGAVLLLLVGAPLFILGTLRPDSPGGSVQETRDGTDSAAGKS